jgi:hypothetical protein
MLSEERKAEFQKALQGLCDPLRLRILFTGIALAVAYFAIYTPLSGKIDVVSRRLSEERKREKLAEDVEFLRAQVTGFEQRLQPGSDPNQWVQYALEGIRNLPVQLVNFDSDGEKTVGPYKAVVFRLQVMGRNRGLDALIYWLETNPRMFRIDSVKIEPARGQDGQRLMELTLLGLKA